MSEQTPNAEPLPIWFFVGLILLVYGLIVLIGGLLPQDRPTVLMELRPALWWGGLMMLTGAAFFGGSLALRRKRG
ncbi:MAG: hypothetical protein GYA21_13130 [Myxococcales bacterium]|nr:hypothetical protein [Myxococcales bacterium]